MGTSGDAPNWVTLTDGEEIVWSRHPSLVTEAGPIVLGTVLMVVGVAVAVGDGPLGA